MSLLQSKRSVVLLAGSVLVLASLPARGESETFSWREGLKAGQSLEVEVYRGNIVARPAKGAEAEVQIVEKGRSADLARVSIEVQPTRHGFKIAAVYPQGDQVVRKAVDLEVEIRLPVGVDLVGRTAEGNVHAEGLQGVVRAYSLDGDVRISTSSYAEASTVRGDIEATLGAVNWTGTLEFAAVQGNVVVRLPANANTELWVASARGRFETDYFPTTSASGRPGVDLKGTLGKGGRQMELRNVRGTIQLLRHDS